MEAPPLSCYTIHMADTAALEVSMSQAKQTSINIWELLTRTLDLIGLFLSMWLSELLVDNILIGGAVYLIGEVWVIYIRLYNKRNIRLLPSNVRSKGIFVFSLACLLTAALVVFYPYLQEKSTSVVMSLLVAGFILQHIVTDTIAHRPVRSGRRHAALLALAHALFLLGYPVLFFLNRLLLGYAAPPELLWVYAAVIATSAGLYACQLMEDQAKGTRGDDAVALDSDRLMQVRAYRIYNRMVVNTSFALNLSITAFICYMRFLPFRGFGHSLLSLCVWLAFISLVTWLAFVLLRKRYMPRYDRYVIFAAGVALWMVGALGQIYHWWGEGLLSAILSAACIGTSLACMSSVLLVQSYEMKTVIELGVGHIDEGAYERNTLGMLDWSILTSHLLLLVMLTIASFLMDGNAGRIEAALGMQSVLEVVMLILPLGIVAACVVYAMMQPLDRHYAQKLQKYEHQRRLGQSDPPLEDRLKSILVTNQHRRIALRVLKPLLRPLLPCRVLGREHVDTTNGPVIFVCNHMEMLGPIMSILHSPFPVRPWVIQDMLDRDLMYEGMRSGLDKSFGFLPERLRYWLGKKAIPLVLWLLMSADPIPVYRGTVRGLMQTLTLSTEAMAYDDNILIFPETDYPKEGVGAFFTGFVQLARNYHKQCGKSTTFYPMYINARKRTLTYGPGVPFDPDRVSSEERDRIVQTLRDAMIAMAEGSNA